MTRLSLAIALLLLAACQQTDTPQPASAEAAATAAPAPFAFEEASIASLQEQMASGSLTSRALAQAYLDRIDRTKYRLLGGDTDPFAIEEVVVQFVKQPPQQIIDITLEHSYDFGPELPPPPKPMTPPETIPLRETLEAGEGVWTTASLPRTTPDDPVLMRTFIRP